MDYKKKDFDKLKEAVYVDRFDGRIKAIKEAFEKYKKAIEKPSCWQKVSNYLKNGFEV